jgi:hypothetical protein
LPLTAHHRTASRLLDHCRQFHAAVGIFDVNSELRRFAPYWHNCFFEPVQSSLKIGTNHRQSFAERNLSPSFALLVFGSRAINVLTRTIPLTGD